MSAVRWLTLASLLLTARAGAEEPHRRALVIAYNGDDRPGLPALRYADDDGVLWTEALERLGYEVTLLTVPDLETARRQPVQLARAKPPTPAALAVAVDRIRRANAADVAAGRETDTLVVYVGHGDVDANGRAYLTLLGGELDQSALYGQVVDRLGGDFVHVLVDACHAAGVVGSRGDHAAEALVQLRDLLKREQLSSRPNVGMMFAESDSGQTHEWSTLGAGVFSHLARSALLGAADVNLDGRVEYSELQAFVAAALDGLAELPAHMVVHTFAPPLNPRRALAGRSPPGPVLVLPRNVGPAKLSVEDEDGRRLLDVHRVRAEAVVLRLPVRTHYRLRGDGGEVLVTRAELEDGLPELVAAPSDQVVARGALGEALDRGLFQAPFGRAFYQGFAASSGLVPVSFEHTAQMRLPAPGGGARWLRGFELGVFSAAAPLGASALGYGLGVAWKSGEEGLRFGARVSYEVAPGAWVEHGTLHRVSALAIAALEPAGRVVPFGELGAGVAAILGTASFGTQADLAVPTARAEAGAAVTFGRVRVKLGLMLRADWVHQGGSDRLDLSPGLTLEFQPRARGVAQEVLEGS